MEGRPLSETESELVGRAIDGDVAAFEELVRIHQRMALRVAFLVLRDHAEAEDVAQDAFVKAYRHLGRFRRESPFRPWLLRIVRNEAINRGRRRSRQQSLALRLANEQVSGEAAPSPETALVGDERSRAVLAAVEALPARFRAVVAIRFLLGLSEAETAATLGIPSGTVKSRTARGLARLRDELEGIDA
ncbi:MAG: RNA polymerase sigma factor [Acidimicrobiia bacterium]